MNSTTRHEQDTVQRRIKAEIISCPSCDHLVPNDFSCSNCGMIYSMQGLIDTLVNLGQRKPDPIVVLQ